MHSPISGLLGAFIVSLLIWGCSGAGWVSAQSASLTVTNVTGTMGNPVDVPIVSTQTHEADGFSLGVLHRSADVSVSGVALGAAVTAMQAIEATVPSFFNVNLTPTLPTLSPPVTGGFTVGLIFDFTLSPTPLPGPTRLPVSATPLELLVVTYTIAPTAVVGAIDLEFSGALGSPPVELIAALSVPSGIPGEPDPVEVVPATVNGVLTVANAPFIRGDLNDSGGLSLIDGVILLYRMFGLQPPGTCGDAEDINDDGEISLLDPLALFEYLFSSGLAPLSPFPDCGDDGTPAPLLGGCVSSGFCP